MALRGLIALYPPATRLAVAAAPSLLRLRAYRGKEDPARLGERMGHADHPRPNGQVMWFHGASVGESRSVLPLIERLVAARPDLFALVTTGTLTSARLLAGRLPERAVHQFAPLDGIAYVRRFLNHWRPDVALWIDSEFWPNLMTQTAARGVPMMLLNGRISERTLRGWRRFPASSASLLSCFSRCFAIDEENAARLEALGAKRVDVLGNLKFAAPPLDADADDLIRFETILAARPRWLAASTQAPEETVAAEVHQIISRRLPGLLTMIVPRHPERGPDVAAGLRGLGVRVALRSAGDWPMDDTDILLADTIGELGLFYRLAPVALVGRSLSRHGGSNPLEAARLGCAVVHGPHTANFASLYRDMNAAGAALAVHNKAELAEAVSSLIMDGGKRGALTISAKQFTNRMDGILDEAADRILRALPPRGERQ